MDDKEHKMLKSEELIEESTVNIGSLIHLQINDKESKWFSIGVDIPNHQNINKESKFSAVLIGKKVGDIIDFGAGFTILEIKKYQNPNTYRGLPNGKIVWIFQANPDNYKIFEAIKDESIGPIIHWNIKQYANEIHIGDIALIWVSGKKAGIYFIGEIISMPTMLIETVSERKYWTDKNENPSKNLLVKLNIFQDLTANPVLKEKIKHIENTKNLSIIKQPRGTNFKVTYGEWETLKELVKYNRKFN